MFPRPVAKVLCSDQIEPDRLKRILYLNIDMNLVSATDFVPLYCVLLIALEMIWTRKFTVCVVSETGKIR